MLNPFSYFFDKSIKRAVMASFVFVLLLPMGFLVYSLFENTWEQAQQNMLQKHELIASAMVEPINLFITARQHSLQALGKEILLIEMTEKEQKAHKIQNALQKHQQSFRDLITISYESTHGFDSNLISTQEQYSPISKKPSYLKIPLNKLSPIDNSDLNTDLLSPIFRSSISNQPVVLLKHYISNSAGEIKGALFSEISPKYVTDMCSKISFGDKGHCAIVDQTGHVVAHPNKSWIKEIRDLSKISIVQTMLDGKSGTTEFYSPFLKADMVAGYSPIPNLGWGVMIPQPKLELTRTLDTLRNNTLIWLSLGLLIALSIAYLLTQKITTPIRTLMDRAHEVSAGYDFIKLGTLPKNSPREINQLWESISLLLTGLQKSNREVKKLNISLNRDINKATKKLRLMNKHLYDVSSKDYLTALANRRYFTNQLNKVINQKKNEKIGLILIDIDKFKFINDKYGHEAGDIALKQLSRILKKLIRKEDLVSRLGGDEFIVYIKDSTDNVLVAVAEKIRFATKTNPIKVKNKFINLTLSIGIVNYQYNGKFITLEELLRRADSAMYTSKQSGRNKVSSYKVEAEKSVAEVN